MAMYWATFGASDKRSGYVVEIHAETRDEAQSMMFATHGRQWAFLYSDIDKVHPSDKAKGTLEILGGNNG